ncbi:MAG: 4Fe-4S dicluster domain-containing protein [Persephonella sp.]|nr:4Fe-4S dicluster domain-containing protein [Persephonella sp.]
MSDIFDGTCSVFIFIYMKKIEKSDIKELFEAVKKEYSVVAPTLKDKVIGLDFITDINQIPSGFVETEKKNSYRAEKGSDRFFSYSRPYLPFKRFLIPPEFTFMKIKKENSQLTFEEVFSEEKIALFDIRPCDLKGLQILDDVFITKNPHPDSYYRKVRENLFIVAVTCFSPTENCFCSSMGISLKPENGYDILITEMKDSFLIRAGSEKGRRILDSLTGREVSQEDLAEEEKALKETEKMIIRSVNTDSLPQILYSQIESKQWEEVGSRCLACTSCTQVCPTCFCFNIVEKNSPDGSYSERIRIYDSCFSPEFATVHRFNIRQSIASRYRQWLMHKFAYWTDQFGSYGCVGCGRCITWCPAGIDITEEIKSLRGEIDKS